MKAIDIQVYKKIFYDIYILLWTTWLLENHVRSFKKKFLPSHITSFQVLTVRGLETICSRLS